MCITQKNKQISDHNQHITRYRRWVSRVSFIHRSLNSILRSTQSSQNKLRQYIAESSPSRIGHSAASSTGCSTCNSNGCILSHNSLTLPSLRFLQLRAISLVQPLEECSRWLQSSCRSQCKGFSALSAYRLWGQASSLVPVLSNSYS